MYHNLSVEPTPSGNSFKNLTVTKKLVMKLMRLKLSLRQLQLGVIKGLLNDKKVKLVQEIYFEIQKIILVKPTLIQQYKKGVGNVLYQIESNIHTPNIQKEKNDFDNSSLFSWSRIRQRYLFI